jgi:Na+-transporting methylmalonyl-CoA/oxaloacetate decarboxylase gamma subunit
MSGLNEIATTGAPVIVTALGMGTVFLCPKLLYLTTQAVGRWLPRLLGSAREAAPVEGVEFEERVVALPPAREVSAAVLDAAMALALARHRSARARSVVEEPGGADAWKLDGRIRTLRVR